MMVDNNRSKNTSGIALLEVALAITIFALAVTALVVVLDRIVTTSNDYSWDRLLQSSMASYIAEAKQKPVSEITGEYFDENLEVMFRSELVPLDLSNADGDGLEDLYQLTVIAEYQYGKETRTEQAELFIYQPEQR